MSQPILSEKRARIVSSILMLFGLAILAGLGTWWPAIMLVIGLSLAISQFLRSHYYDMAISLFVFVGIFITFQFKVSWDYLLPVLFTIGGLYLIFKEFILPRRQTEKDDEEEVIEEISEKKKKS